MTVPHQECAETCANALDEYARVAENAKDKAKAAVLRLAAGYLRNVWRADDDA
jgi:hypothetical protein